MRLQNLGYAVTAHRAQGMTVDTSHVVVTGSTTRENFYVSMTRGRDSNIAYVALDRSPQNLKQVFLACMHMCDMETGGNKALSFGKSKAKLSSSAQKKVTFRDVAGAARPHDGG